MGSRQSTTNSPSRVVQPSDDNSTATIGSGSYSTPFRTTSTRSTNSDNEHLSNNNNNNNNTRDWRNRTRSLTAMFAGDNRHASNSSAAIDFSSTSSQDILNEDTELSSFSLTPHSLPIHFHQYNFNQVKCLFCSKIVLQTDFECHYLLCITKPQLIYNDDVLTEDKGECVICLEEMVKGDKIARLPCLCIYHKHCIDAWFDVNRSCPEHPVD